MSLQNIFPIAGSALLAQQVRLNTTASNLANADSVGTTPQETYRAREPVFANLSRGLSTEHQPSGVSVLGIVERDTPVRMEHRPNHPLADAKGYVHLPNVNPIEEMANMISASRSFEVNVEVLNTTKQLLLRTLTLGE
jgi:flagellar basal-body rod protein FlgC